ncbi:MAG: M1 family peptidase [Ignavibacteriae bacterium]|nr:MAG: M1 family peptidase [Ignavibacteriota bacterium]
MADINSKGRNIKIPVLIILVFTIVFNLALSYSLYAGAKYFTANAVSKKESIAELINEEVNYFAQKIYSIYMENTMDGSQRVEDSTIVARQRLFDVMHYDLSLSFDLKGKSISGEMTMTANALTDTLDLVYINLYQNMKVSSVKFSSANNPDPVNPEYKQQNDYVIITVNNKLSRNEDFNITINYSGIPVTLGAEAFTIKEIYGSPVAYNLSEPNYSPTWWPGKDLPEDKATSSMHLTVPRGFKGVSNGVLVDTVQNENGTTTFNWKSTYPIATYLVSIVVGKFSYWEDTYTSVDGSKTMPVVYYAFPKDSANAVIDWRGTPEMIKFYAKTFGEYPFIDEKYGMVQFGWTQGAMEHQTITSMGYLLVTGDNRYDQVVVHELAHQWFGDAVTLQDWKNIWLNEGFATYSEALWEEYKLGKSSYLSYMKNLDYGYFSRTVYAPEGYIFSPAVYATVYNKGGWVLHMLRGVMGDEPFFKLLKDYYAKYEFKNAETKDFQLLAEEISGQTLDWFFDQWVYTGKGRPKYEYSWKFEDFQDQPNSGAYTVRLNLKQVQEDRPVYKMPVKINVVTAGGSKEFTVFNDKREQSFLLTVDSNPKEVQVDREGWILKKIAKGKYE